MAKDLFVAILMSHYLSYRLSGEQLDLFVRNSVHFVDYMFTLI